MELELPEGLKSRGLWAVTVKGRREICAIWKVDGFMQFKIYKNDLKKTLESIQNSFPKWYDKKTSAHFIAYIGTEYDKLNSDDTVKEKTTVPPMQQKILRVMLEQYELDALKTEFWPTIELPICELPEWSGTCGELRLHLSPYENQVSKPCENPLTEPYYISCVNVNKDTLFSDPIMDPKEEPVQIERIIDSVKASIDKYCSGYTGIKKYAIRTSLMQQILESKRRICQACYDERSKVANDARRRIGSLPDTREMFEKYCEGFQGDFSPFHDPIEPHFTLSDAIQSVFSIEDEQTLINSGAITYTSIDVQDARKRLRTDFIENTNRAFPNEQELLAYLLKYCNDYGEPYKIQECEIFYLGIDYKKRPRFKVIVHFSEPEGHSQVFDVPNTPTISERSESVYVDGQMIYNADLDHNYLSSDDFAQWKRYGRQR